LPTWMQKPQKRRPRVSLTVLASIISFLVLQHYLVQEPYGLLNLAALRGAAAHAPFPFSPAPAPPFPKTVWWKLGPNGRSEDIRKWTDGCMQLNKGSGYNATFLTDASAKAFVIENFHHRPDIVETFLGLPAPIVKADMLRYLIL
jgi:mannosyltransferase OCH1-like enzyme